MIMKDVTFGLAAKVMMRLRWEVEGKVRVAGVIFELEEEWCKGGKWIGMECVDCVDGVVCVVSRELSLF